MYRNSETPIAETGSHALPHPNRKLLELANDVVRCAQPLLPPGSGMFLGLQREQGDVLRLIWWRGGDFAKIAEISAPPEGFCPEDMAEGALQEAASALLEYLAGRWPAAPAQFGVVTDGVGVAFAPDHPAPATSGWLLRHAGGAPLTMILPLDREGPCALLYGPSFSRSFH